MASVSLTGWMKCIKYGMFVFCLIAWLMGLITFTIGIVVRVNGSFGTFDSHIPAVHSGANLLIAVGFFIMIMGFFGCCGTIRESQCMLIIFFLTVFFCFTLLMAAGLWAVAWSTKLHDYLFRFLDKHVSNYHHDERNHESTQIMDYIQQTFKCCGVTSAADYIKFGAPKSCGSPLEQVQRKGCFPLLKESCRTNLSLIQGIGIGFAFILIAGMVFSIMLCCALREIS